MDKIREQKKTGTKNKYQFKEDEKVYDIVDDDEYASLVTERQKDEWIEDDGLGDGYVEHGREIFDEDMDDDDDPYGQKAYKKSRRKGKKIAVTKRKIPQEEDSDEEEIPASKAFGQNIRDMFRRTQAANHLKKKVKMTDIKLDDDEVLKNILHEMNSDEEDEDGSSSVGTSSQSTSSGAISRRIMPPLPPLNMRRQLQDGKKTVVCENLSTYERLKQKMDLHKFNRFKVPISSASRTIRDLQPDEAELDKILEHQDAENDRMALDDGFDLSSVSMAQLMSRKNNPTASSSKVVSSGPPVKVFSSKNIPESTTDLLDDAEWGANNESAAPTTLPAELDSELPFFTDEKINKKFLKFYYLDACDSLYEKGVVYLFGKIKMKSMDKFVSCCIKIESVEKRIFLMPRETDAKTGEPVTKESFQAEFDSIAKSRFNIKTFKYKESHKFYSFDDPKIPKEADFFEIMTPANCRINRNDDLQNLDTAFGVCGANVSSLERFIIDRKLKGPAWLKILNPVVVSSPVSWCKVEFTVPNPRAVFVDDEDKSPAPPVTLVSISLRTFVNPVNNNNEVIAISVLADRDFNLEKGSSNNSKGLKFDTHFCLITKPSGNCDIMFPIDLIPQKINQVYKKTKG